jgi:hypothetical protein
MAPAFSGGTSLSKSVWSRNEVVRVDDERFGVVRPGIADGLNGCSPAQ